MYQGTGNVVLQLLPLHMLQGAAAPILTPEPFSTAVKNLDHPIIRPDPFDRTSKTALAVTIDN